MDYRLKKDIVIKAGTIFTQAPSRIDLDADHVIHTVGLTKNTVGSLYCELSKDFPQERGLYFEPVENKPRRKK